MLHARGRGQVVVAQVELQALRGFPFGADIEVLQAWRESAEVGGDIEEVHGAVETVVGAVDGGEALHLFVQDEPEGSRSRHRIVVVAAQVVISRIGFPVCRGAGNGLEAHHPRLQIEAVFLLAALKVKRCMGRKGLRFVAGMAAKELLLEGAVLVGALRGLHAHVHEQQRHSQPRARQVVVVPQGLQGLVGLQAAAEVRAVVHVFGVLVEREYGVRLVHLAFISESERIVRLGRHRPVVGSENALVVIGELLAAQGDK